ncbi:terminase [Kitasatospora sp. NPDC001574]
MQIAAVSRDQTRNTMTLMPSLMSDRLVDTYGIKAGAELIRANGGKQRLEAVTSSYRALEGGRSTFVVLNESHHWVRGNNGDKMYETIDGNATKKDSRYLAITNAYLPGEDSVAERMREAYEKIREGRAADIGFLYDSIEAHPATPLTPEAIRIVLPRIRGDAVWLRIETILQSILDTTLSPSRSRRMWLNQIVASEDAIYGPAEWDVLRDDAKALQPGDEITVGFDGGLRDDSTALVALRVSDMAAFVLGLWEKPDGPRGDGWEVPRDQVDSAVHQAFRVFAVQGMYADVALWESYISEWSDQYGEGLAVRSPLGKDSIGWDMRSSLKTSTLAHERLMRAIFDRKIRHDGDRALRRHVLNATRRTNNHGLSFGKESKDSPRKVDLYAALMLAHECLVDLRARGKRVRKRTGRGFFL